MSAVNRDRVREALNRIERSERNYKLALASAVALEAGLLTGFLLLVDFSNQLHTLLFLATVGVWSLVALGLIALGAHVSRCTERVLKAIERPNLEAQYHP